jgi:MFS superfamily sulfate permease-like transporter
MYWFGAALYYANAPHFAEDVRRLVHASPTPVRWLVVDTGAVTTLDYTASEVLRELQRDLECGGVTLALARVSDGLQADLDRLRLRDVLGPARIFASRRECLAAYAAAART